MYKVTATTDGIRIGASKLCRTKREAESVKAKLAQLLEMHAQIKIMPIGSPR